MNERFERGLARQAEMGGFQPIRHEVYNNLADIAPDLSRLAVEFAYGDIHARPGLDPARRELVILGILVALGDTAPQIEAHVGLAKGAGVGNEEIVEAIMQGLPYVGFPRVIAALTAARPMLVRKEGEPI